MTEPIISSGDGDRIAADGRSFGIHEWRGSGPSTLHVHHSDDEAWHVLEGSVTFRFVDGERKAGPGSTVFVPAGVPHSFSTTDARYLIILTPRLRALIRELQETSDSAAHAAIYVKFDSEVLE